MKSRPGVRVLVQASVCLFFAFVVSAVFYPAFVETKPRPHRRAIGNIKVVATGLMIYCSDYDDHLPPSEDWMDTLYPYVNNWEIFRIPGAKQSPSQFDFALNKHVAGLNAKAVDPITVMNFSTCQPRKNAAGSSSILGAYDDENNCLITHVDSSAKSVPCSQPLHWIPQPRGNRSFSAWFWLK